VNLASWNALNSAAEHLKFISPIAKESSIPDRIFKRLENMNIEATEI